MLLTIIFHFHVLLNHFTPTASKDHKIKNTIIKSTGENAVKVILNNITDFANRLKS